MSDEIRLIHLADVHLGHTGSKSLVFGENEAHAGRYVREVDIENAVRRLIKGLKGAQPPVDAVLIAGDFFGSRIPSPRAVDTAAKMIRQLTERQIDVVIVDGNHDSAVRIHAGSPLSFLREFGGYVHIVNDTDYEIVRDAKWQNPRLHGRLAVHCLPYRAVLNGQFAGVNPLPNQGCANVLLAHGRVAGMPEQDTMGLSAARIPPELLRRGWDYVALGDWHVHRHCPLRDVHAYYPGSLEALTFGEARQHPARKDDPNATRGGLDIRLQSGSEPIVTTLANSECRPLLRLQTIDANDMNAKALMEILVGRLDNALPQEALVLLEVKNLSRDVWEKLDHTRLQELRARVRRCDIHLDFLRPVTSGSAEAASEATVEQQWEGFLAQRIPDEAARKRLLDEGRACIEAARQKLQRQRVEAGEA
jgi:DNA repair exonuclease SbcCD nuclease subunit